MNDVGGGGGVIDVGSSTTIGPAVARTLPGRPLPPRGATPVPAARPPTGRAWVPNATLVGRDDLTESTAIFRVHPEDGPPALVAGQYVSLGLRLAERVVLRPYSPASAPGSHELELLIRHVPGGTFTSALWGARLGSRVSVGRAKGVFTLRPDDARTHLFVATGTGLAPFVSMVGALRDRPRPPRAVVVHGVAHMAELAFRERLERAEEHGAIDYVPAVSRSGDPRNAGWAGLAGRVTDVLPLLFAGGLLDPGTTIAYLCGNPAMIESATGVLAGLGLASDAIVTERYWATEAV